MSFTTADGLAHNHVSAILPDRDGHLWFSTWGGGVSRYDGATFTTYTKRDGLGDDYVFWIVQDREGDLWFATVGGGVSRYDGDTFTTYTTEDGLAEDRVYSLLEDRDGHLWFGTHTGGVSRFDGKSFTTFTTQDGLAANYVCSGIQSRDGHLWFINWGGGVSRFDGHSWSVLTAEDGLASNGVVSALQDRAGQIWFSTQAGLTRYRPPSPSPPPVFVDAVVADRRYEDPSRLAVPSSANLLHFEFHGMSLKTRPEAMLYRYRLAGRDSTWRTTHAQQVEYEDLPWGSYTFEVVAVDRDLTYSAEPAVVTVRVRPPYERQGWLSALSLAVAAITWQAWRLVRRNTALNTANRVLRDEMETRARVERERSQLDEQLRRLRYLFRLRSALAGARSNDGVVEQAAACLLEVLAASPPGSVRMELDDRSWSFGEPGYESQVCYERPLTWGDRQRGRLRETCGIELSESQERTLLDETAGHLAATLEARELEEQLLLSSRLASLGRMAAGVAHEINNPLAGLRSCLRRIAKAPDNVSQIQSYTTMMVDAVDRIGNIARGMLNLAHPERLVEEPLQVPDAVRDALALAEHQLRRNGIELETELADDLPRVRGDRDRLGQVFLNLILNAVDAMPSGGRLSISCGRHGEQIATRVKDTGSGIPETDLAKVFDPFYTTKSVGEGTGLGLSIAHGIVDKHGGRIDVSSHSGEGTEFTVVLPAIQPKADPA